MVEAHNSDRLGKGISMPCPSSQEQGQHIGKRRWKIWTSLWPQSDCLSVEVTTHCNSSCSHCFVRARGQRRSSLAPDLVRTMVREGYEAGYRHLHLTGGEPLLWEGLLDILDYAFGLGYQTAFLNTNGTLLTGKISRNLANYNGLTISISLQGPRRFHDRIRGKGSYDRALKGINQAIDAGLAVHIFTPVGRSLIPELPRFAEKLFVNLPGIKQLTLIQLIRVPEDVFDLSKEVLSPDDFLRLVRMISLLNLYGLKVDLLNNPLAAVASRVLKMPWISRSPPLVPAGKHHDHRGRAYHTCSFDRGSFRNSMNGVFFRKSSTRTTTAGRCRRIN